MTSIALIGPGRHGTAIATLFAQHGVDVTLYHHRQAKAQAAATAVRAAALPGTTVTVADSLASAVDGQELVVLATLWDAPQRAVLSELGDALKGKVILEISNPLDVTPTGVVRRVPPQGSAGQFFATLLPEGVGHAKAFSNLGTAAILEGADHEPPAVLPFIADSQATAQRVLPYLQRTGWQPWFAGTLERSVDIEIGGKFNDVSGRWGRSRLDAEQMLAYDGPERPLR